MSERLGHVALDRDRRSIFTPDMLGAFRQERDYLEATAAAVDKEVQKIIESAFGRTVTLLRERRDILERAARRLLENETLDERELLELAGSMNGTAIARRSRA